MFVEQAPAPAGTRAPRTGGTAAGPGARPRSIAPAPVPYVRYPTRHLVDGPYPGAARVPNPWRPYPEPFRPAAGARSSRVRVGFGVGR